MTTFAQRPRELKEAKGVSFSQMAKGTGIGIAVLYRYTAGKTEPNLPYFTWLADYFGVSLDYLAGRDDP